MPGAISAQQRWYLSSLRLQSALSRVSRFLPPQLSVVRLCSQFKESQPTISATGSDHEPSEDQLEPEPDEEQAVGKPDDRPVTSQTSDWTISALRDKLDRGQLLAFERFTRIGDGKIGGIGHALYGLTLSHLTKAL